jgi:hypothetical protein
MCIRFLCLCVGVEKLTNITPSSSLQKKGSFVKAKTAFNLSKRERERNARFRVLFRQLETAREKEREERERERGILIEGGL